MEDAEGVGRARKVVSVASGIVGSVAGGLFRVPLMILAPGWIFLTFPLALGALLAAGLAYLASGPRRGPFSRVVAVALLAALACGLVNLAMLLLLATGVAHPALVIGPIGLLGGLLEALLVGGVAGATATRGDRRAPGGRGAVRTAGLCLAVAVLILGALTLPGMLACSGEERDVFGEFPQHGGLRPEPTGNPEVGSCAAYYHTRSPADEVFAYFERQFEENGWNKRPAESYRIVVEGGEEFCIPSDLVAERGGFRYRVVVEEIDPEAGGHAPGTSVAAHVSRTPEGERSLPQSGPPPGCRLRSPESSGG